MRAGIYLVTNSHPQVFGVARGNIFSRFASQRRWDGMSRIEVGNLHTNFSSPTRWFSSRFVTRPTNQNRNGPKMFFFTFLENAPRVLGVPRGSQGVPWGIYHTKTKLWAPEKDLSGSRRPILRRKCQKIKKRKKR